MNLASSVTPTVNQADVPWRVGTTLVPGCQGVSDRPRVLLCDDESQTLHALRAVLRGGGFEVEATRSAADALDRSALGLASAAIIELVLPDGDGVEVCRGCANGARCR